MGDLLTMLNHLLATWLAEQGGGGAIHVREIRLDGRGALVLARLDHKDFNGEAVLRLIVEPAQGQRQTIRIGVEQWPERLPAALEPFRKLLESARLAIELDLQD